MINSIIKNKKIEWYIKLQCFLLIFLPFSLISGPFLVDFSITIISLIFITMIIKYKKYELLNDYFFKVFFLFWIYISINSILINTNFDSIKISLAYLRFGIFVYAIVFILNRNDKILKYIFFSLLICFIILSTDGIYQYFNGKNILGYKTIVNYRVSSLFKDELILGSYLSRLLPIFLAIYLYSVEKKNFFKKEKYLLKYILYLIFPLTILVIYLSGERSAFFLTALFLCFILISFKNYLKLRLSIVCISTILIIITSIINPKAFDRIFVQVLNTMKIQEFIKNDNRELDQIVIFTQQHTDHYNSAYKMIKHNFLFGLGVKNFRNFCKDEKYFVSEISCSTHPHNTYIQIFAETGFVGFMFIISSFLYLIFLILKNLIYKSEKKKYFYNYEICLLGSILITLWPIIPTGSFFNNWLSAIYYLPVGILIWSLKNKNNKILYK